MSRKLLFFVTEDWYFCSHRLPVAQASRDQGYDVIVVTRVQEHADIILKEGFRLVPVKLRRRSKNPFREICSLLEIWKIYRSEKPDIVHHVALKPVLYGSIAALFSGRPKVVNAIAGFGFVFTSKKWQARILRPLVKIAYRLLFGTPGVQVIVQNPDDRALLTESLHIDENQVSLIQGSGVDLLKFKPHNEPDGPVIVAFVGRMLWDKGVGEFVEAVHILKQKGCHFFAILVGEPDEDNPGSISRKQLVSWHEEGNVEWKGFQADIVKIWTGAHIATLPSYYGEGIPKSLIEAAACGRPVVTTDMPGCRVIVRNNENGFLVPARNAQALADALEKLIRNSELRQQMGACGRKMVENEFSVEKVVQETLTLYRRLVQ